MSNGWMQDTDGKWYYFNLAAYMVADDTTPDGYYVGADGAWDGQPSFIVETGPNLGSGGDANALETGWEQSAEGWKYRQTDGTYVTNTWFQTEDGKWYYFGADSIMLAGTLTPDGFYVGQSGAWDGQPVE